MIKARLIKHNFTGDNQNENNESEKWKQKYARYLVYLSLLNWQVK